jgi:hypothetical protein
LEGRCGGIEDKRERFEINITLIWIYSTQFKNSVLSNPSYQESFSDLQGLTISRVMRRKRILMRKTLSKRKRSAKSQSSSQSTHSRLTTTEMFQAAVTAGAEEARAIVAAQSSSSSSANEVVEQRDESQEQFGPTAAASAVETTSWVSSQGTVVRATRHQPVVTAAPRLATARTPASGGFTAELRRNLREKDLFEG